MAFYVTHNLTSKISQEERKVSVDVDYLNTKQVGKRVVVRGYKSNSTCPH